MKFFIRSVAFFLFVIFTTLLFSACSNNKVENQRNESRTTTQTTTVNLSTMEKYVVTAEFVNIRKEPNTNSEVIDIAYKNTLLNVISQENKDWFKLILSDQTQAYIYAKYISPISNSDYKVYLGYQLKDKEKKYAVISDNEYANIRQLPTTSSDVVSVYRKNDTIEILGTTQNEWYLMKHNDSICYIYSEIVKLLTKAEYNSYNTKTTKGNFDSNNCVMIGSYSTNYFSYDSPNRNFNIEKAAKELDNMEIKKGYMFNWCRDMGACGKEDGYKESIEIQNKQYVTGYGGGICQVSSTLCAAILSSKSNFTIIDRTKHAIAQSYIPSELDATVSYPDCNFIFKNDNSYNVILKTHYDGSTLTVEIYKMNDVIV